MTIREKIDDYARSAALVEAGYMPLVEYIQKYGEEVKLDSLGRRNKGWAKAGPGRKRLCGMALTEFYNLRLDKETLNELKARAKKSNTTVADKLRDYIEWGLENEE